MTTNTPQPQSANRNAYWLPGLSFLVGLPALIVSVIDIVIGQTGPAIIATIITGLFLVVTLSTLWLAQRGRPVTSTLVQLVAVAVYAALLTLQFDNFVSSLLLVVALGALLSASQVLPTQRLNQAVPIGVLVTVGILILDAFWPAPRFPILATVQVYVQIAGWLFAGLLALLVARRYRQFPLRIKLLVILLTVTLIPLTLVTFSNNQTAANVLSQQSVAVLRATSNQLTDDLDSFINRHEELLRAATQPLIIAAYLRLPAEERAENALRQVMDTQLAELHGRTESTYSSVALLDNTGRVVNAFRFAGLPVRQGLDVGALQVNAIYFTALANSPENFELSPVLYTSDPPDGTFYFSRAIYDNVSGELLGAMVIQYNTEVLSILLGRDLPDLPSAFPLLIDNRNLVLASPNQPALANRILVDAEGVPQATLNELRTNRLIPTGSQLLVPANDFVANLRGFASGASFIADDPQTGAPLQVVAQQLQRQTAWRLVIAQPQATILAPIVEQQRINTLGGALLAAGVVGLALLFTGVLTSPLVRLNDMATQVAGGDYSVEATIESEDEIGALSETFNQMTERLRLAFSTLEDRVSDRTQQLYTVANLARNLTQERNPERLLAQAVESITRDFDLYYAGIFLVNENGDQAVLRAGSGEAGRSMLAERHQLEVGGRSMIGQAVATGQPRVASNVEAERVRFRNPYLPLTSTELALPLRAGTQTVGALTVQSTQPQAFDETDIATFQGLADQIAIALSNAQLISEQTASLERINQLNQALLGGTWQVGQGGANYQYSGDDLQPVVNPDFANLDVVLRRPRLAIEENVPAGRAPRVTLPIMVRGEAIGAYELVPPIGKTHWTAEELNLLEQVISQAGYALETVLLVDQVQRALNSTRQAADRERLLSRITGEIRQNVDVSTILETTLKRLAEVLGTETGEIEIRPTPTTDFAPESPTNGSAQRDAP